MNVQVSRSIFRELTAAELEMVSGGDGGDEVIVIVGDGGGGGGGSGWGGGWGDGGGGGWDGGGGDGGGGGTDTAQWQLWLAAPIVDFLTSFLADRASTAANRESVVANTFNPANVVSQSIPVTVNGQSDPNYMQSWGMSDGTMYFDTNGNFSPDIHISVDFLGNVYANEGAGWVMVRGAG